MIEQVNRIDKMFDERSRQSSAQSKDESKDESTAQSPAIVCFVTAGDPGLEQTVPVMHALVRGGASMLELGMPFSDPMADGPVIQAASERALERGADINYVLQCVSQFRTNDTETPVILMGYLNPLERFGFATFCQSAATAGVDGLLIVDLPPEESECITEHSAVLNIKQIFLVAPTTSQARLEVISQVAGGFIYYVALKGITGAGNLDSADVAKRTAVIREKSALPVAVGFGIKSRQDVEALSEVADGVVVGTALVQALAAAAPELAPSVAENFAKNLSNKVTKVAEGAV